MGVCECVSMPFLLLFPSTPHSSSLFPCSHSFLFLWLQYKKLTHLLSLSIGNVFTSCTPALGIINRCQRLAFNSHRTHNIYTCCTLLTRKHTWREKESGRKTFVPKTLYTVITYSGNNLLFLWAPAMRSHTQTHTEWNINAFINYLIDI